MDKILKPTRLEVDPDSSTAAKEWNYWLRTFENFIEESEVVEDAKKLKVLIHHLSYHIYEYVSECTTYDTAIATLKGVFDKSKGEVFSRFLLATRKQKPEESIDQFFQALKILSKDCNFTAVSAAKNRDDCIRDSFISGLASSEMRQRLLESQTLELADALTTSKAIESSIKHAQFYVAGNDRVNASTSSDVSKSKSYDNVASSSTNSQNSTRRPFKCFFCGGSARHYRNDCPAKDATCTSCNKTGHFKKVCKSRKHNKTTSAITQDSSDDDATTATIIAANPGLLSKAVVPALINDYKANCLIDTGSSNSYINEDFVISHKLTINESSQKHKVSMASISLSTEIKGFVLADLSLVGHEYRNLKLSILPNLCADILIGHDVLKQHSKLNLSFGGKKLPLTICSVAQALVEPVSLFTNLSPDIKPIATKSRRYSSEDSVFISNEVRTLLAEGVIEESTSPWRAQVLVVRNENHRRRMVVDYSQTINRYTLLDAYPVPNIDKMISEISKFSFYSTLDLKSAYHQVPIPKKDRPFTAFEAGGALYQFKVIAFGLTNGVSGFQRFIDKIIRTENLSGVFAYIDDVTVCGRTKQEHDQNLNDFLKATKKYGLTLNEDKCRYSVNTISILGHLISNHTIQPDPERMKSLLDFPPPNNSKSLKRVLGMLAYYSKWIRGFSEKIRPLITCNTFPMPKDVIDCFSNLKREVANSSIATLEEGIPLVVETDASDLALAATLSQKHRPVAFFSRTLTASEQNHSSIEKEASAIVECLRKWKHFLMGRHFTIITDQEALSFIFNQKHSSKIKNDKILRWRLELSSYSFDIIYRPGKDNIVADTLSRICGAMNNNNKLYELHESLCHPGVTRFFHWIRCQNYPYTLDEVRKVVSNCPLCAEVKPRFFRKTTGTLIKATQPFERVSVDFKGPLPSYNGKPYLLTVIDEFSRFPFAIACKDMSSSTVINCFIEIFTVFGMPSYVHSDRGLSFMSREVTSFLHSRGTATSHSSPHHPEGNGQVEKLNDTIWKAITLALKSRGLNTNQWEKVLPDALHSIRSLLCTSINCTPHERIFHHNRRASSGKALPSWLVTPGPVLLKRFDRTSKYEPLVEEVDLLESNPEYAVIRHNSGRESTVALQHLAPRGDLNLGVPEPEPLQSESTSIHDSIPEFSTITSETPGTPKIQEFQAPEPNSTPATPSMQRPSNSPRPQRTHRKPNHLSDYVLY